MASLQISQQSFESCPIAKSPQGSPNPQQPLKKSQDETFFWTKRTEKGQVSKSEAPSSPLAQSQGAALYAQANGPAADGQTAGWGGVDGQGEATNLTPKLSPATQKNLPRATRLPTPAPSPCQWHFTFTRLMAMKSPFRPWLPRHVLGTVCTCAASTDISIPTSMMESNTNIFAEADIKAQCSLSDKLFNMLVAQGFPSCKTESVHPLHWITERRHREGNKALCENKVWPILPWHSTHLVYSLSICTFKLVLWKCLLWACLLK